jgi:hypothetical protein
LIEIDAAVRAATKSRIKQHLPGYRREIFVAIGAPESDQEQQHDSNLYDRDGTGSKRMIERSPLFGP